MRQRGGPVDSVLLVGFGGPTRPQDVMPFLRRVAEGRGVPEERLREVERHYEAVGGRSPYNEQTQRLAEELWRWLAGRGLPLPVYVGMRSWHPLLADTVARMRREGRRLAAGVILAAHRSPASWERYREEADGALRAAGGDGPAVTYLAPWFDDPGFLEACAQRIEEASGHRRRSWPRELPLVFTAHSIPEPMARSSPYVQDLLASCRGVAELLRAERWRLAYQSRSGDPHAPWLGPDIGEVLRDLAAAGAGRVVVQAIGFLSDHVEVLFDLDIEAARLASGLGLNLLRAPCVNAHPEFVAMLGRRIQGLIAGAA